MNLRGEGFHFGAWQTQSRIRSAGDTLRRIPSCTVNPRQGGHGARLAPFAETFQRGVVLTSLVHWPRF